MLYLRIKTKTKNGGAEMNQEIIYQVVNYKTNIRGYWRDDNGKLYKDNIKQVKYIEAVKNRLFDSGELAVLYINNKGQAVIESNDGSETILKNKVSIEFKVFSIKILKDFLKKYGGVTVYKLHTGYIVEAWY